METELELQLSKGEAFSQESPGTATKKPKKKRKRDKERVDDGTVPVRDEKPEFIKEADKQETVNVKIEVIYDRPDRTPPIVVYAPSGYKPYENADSNNLEQPGHGQNPLNSTVKFYRKAQRTKIEKSSNEKNEKWKSSERMELVVSPTECEVDLVGTNYKGEAMAPQMNTFALGVLDKKTGTLKIMPIAGNKVFKLDPKIRGLCTSDKETSVLENEELSGENKAEMMTALTVAYGSKKSLNEIKKRKVLQQGNDPESQGNVENVVPKKEGLESASALVARNIPPYNASATTPQEAYPLNRIILKSEWDFLEDIYNILQVGSGEANAAYPTFVRNRIHKVQEIQNEVERKKLAQIFSYINHLIKFKDLHSLDGSSSAKNHKFPSIVRQRFSELFTPESRRLPIEKIDLLISYVLVLTLYADDFRTDPTDVAKDLRVSPVNLRVHFENLGCKLVRENKLLLATLPVPLSFPSLRQRRRRR